MIVAICEYGIISCKFKEGGYDNFSFKNFIEKTIMTLKNNYKIDNR